MNAPCSYSEAEKFGAFLCVECGKCTALCPMAETAGEFSRLKSPRGIVQQALAGVPIDSMPGLRSCLQCRQCSQTCPAGVDVAGLIAALRSRLEGDSSVACAVCGRTLLPADAARYLGGMVDGGFEEHLAYPMLCPSCRRKAYARNNS